MTELQEILQRVNTLPPLPDTAMKLINVLNDPTSTVNDIVETIRYDQAVTTEVLKWCNSAYFGLARKVTSLNDAMLYLGTAKVLQLVMAVHTNALLSKAQVGYGLEPGVLWTHSVAVAIASSALAQRLHITNVGLLFTAGLLHDIGKVILNQYVAEEFAAIVRRVTEDKLSFLDAEHEILGFSHAEVGALLAEKWQLPEVMVRCIRHHHDPKSLDPPDPLVDTVYLANCVCLLLGLGLGEDGLSYRADEGVTQRHGLTEHDLEAIGLQTMTELKRVQEMFCPSTETGPSPVAVGPWEHSDVA